jgi:peptide/nickel transport system substrate-binding protein
MKYLISLCLITVFIFSSTLHLSISSNPSRINPILATDSASGEISSWIFNALVKYDKDGKVVPELAKSYHFSDKTTLVFKLRSDVKWSDGKPFSAKDVIFTYKLITSPKVFTPYADDFKYVKSIKALDDYTVSVKYKQPYFKAVEIWMMGLLPAHLWKNEKHPMTSKLNSHPIGTGPYILRKFTVNKNINLFANKNYFLHKPYIDKIVYSFMPDPSTQFLMLKSHKLDVGSITPLQYERQIDKSFKDYYNIYEMPSHGYTYMGFNLENKKFKDIKVRVALSLAIDRKELSDILFFGHAKPCRGPFMPGTFAYNEKVKIPKVNLKKARELLKKAGYDKSHPLTFTLTTNSNNSTRVYAAQILQYQFAKIGVKMKIRTLEWQAFLNTVIAPRHFEAILLGWGLGLTPDAYSIWHGDSDKPGGFNFVHYHNKEVDKLITKAEKMVDKKELSKIYKKIFKLIVQDKPYLFLYIPNSITVVNKKIKNVTPSIIGVMHNEIEWIKP